VIWPKDRGEVAIERPCENRRRSTATNIRTFGKSVLNFRDLPALHLGNSD
jgi:hypothetical protein